MRCLGCMKEIADNVRICPLCGYDQSSPAKEPYHMSPGSMLAERYLIGKVLGYGGFGVTYIGYDNVLSHTVAVKEYLPGEFSTRMPGDQRITVYSGEKHEQFISGKEKFLDEARRLAKFRNTEGIVEIYDVFEMNDTSYIVMEYLEGESIRSRIEREGVFYPEEAAELMKPVMEALRRVHAEGIIHRDIAPDNIYILNDGRVKILDFGAARYASTNFSKSLSVILKQGYAPEEQYRSRGAQGEWSDVYALGATMYKMITGTTPEDAIERTVRDELVPPSKLGIKISKKCENAIMNALNVYREDRTQSVKEFMDELYEDGDVTRRIGKLRRSDTGKWKKWQIIAVSAAGAVGLCVALLFITGVIDLNSKNKLEGNIITLSENQVYVPDLLGKDVDEAVGLTEKRGVRFRVTDKQYSMTVDEDLIMTQDPDAGSVGDKTALMMNVIVSGGKPIVEIGNYLGKNIDEIKKELEAAGIVVEVKEEKSNLTQGSVIRQSIEDGTLVRAGDKISFVVAVTDSSETIDPNVKHKIGDYSGLPSDDFSSVEFSGKYKYEIVTEFSNTVGKNKIISSDPPAGTELAEGQTIKLIVSKGAETITVPDVQYKSREEASRLITDAGLAVDIRTEASSVVAEDHVIRQSVESGTKLKRGDSVVIYVSTGDDTSDVAYEEQVQEEQIEEHHEEPVTQAPTPAATTAPVTAAPTEAATELITEPAVNTEPPTEHSGTKLGDHIYAEVKDGELVVSGYGDMYDFSENDHPSFLSADSISIADGITSIGSYAFCGADIKGRVSIPGSVRTIGSSAFLNSSITSVVAYSGLEYISNYAFYGCSNLTSVRLPYGTNYSADGGSHSYIFDTIDVSKVTITN